MEKENWHSKYIAPIIVGIILLFVFQSYYDNQKIKGEIDSYFIQADNSFNNSQFEEAIGEYNEVSKLSYNKFPDKYALAQFKKGLAYVRLAEVRDKEINAQNAINAFQKALEIFTADKYPFEYANTQLNLGRAHNLLGEIRNKEINVQKAINAFQEALKVYTADKYPIEYADTQNNLGNAYFLLADVINTETNAQKAINAYQEALKVYTIETYPNEYANTQRSLEYAKGLLL